MSVSETTSPIPEGGAGTCNELHSAPMEAILCTSCNAPMQPKGTFTIPVGTSKTVVRLLQCRGCKSITVQVEEKENEGV